MSNRANIDAILKTYTREEIVEMVKQLKIQEHKTKQAIKFYKEVQSARYYYVDRKRFFGSY